MKRSSSRIQQKQIIIQQNEIQNQIKLQQEYEKECKLIQKRKEEKIRKRLEIKEKKEEEKRFKKMKREMEKEKRRLEKEQEKERKKMERIHEKQKRKEDKLNNNNGDNNNHGINTDANANDHTSSNNDDNVRTSKDIIPPVKKKRKIDKVKFKPKIQREEIDISNETVEIITATAAQIRKSRTQSSSSNSNSNNNKKQLVIIPSPKERCIIYQETAKAIAINECQALPPNGGRPWECIVTVYDEYGGYGIASSLKGDVIDQTPPSSQSNNNNNSSSSTKKRRGKKLKAPLFRWFRNKLELACLPHLFEEINVIDTNHGLLKSVKEDYEKSSFVSALNQQTKATDLTSRQITTLSTIAFNDDEYALPKVDRKWISPDHVVFRNNRKKTIEHCALLDERDKVIDKVLHGIGVRGASIRPVKPTRKQALEAGYFRFLRDGLWVVGQEEDWIEKRIEELNDATSDEDVEDAMVNGEREEAKVEKGQDLLSKDCSNEIQLDASVFISSEAQRNPQSIEPINKDANEQKALSIDIPQSAESLTDNVAKEHSDQSDKYNGKKYEDEDKSSTDGNMTHSNYPKDNHTQEEQSMMTNVGIKPEIQGDLDIQHKSPDNLDSVLGSNNTLVTAPKKEEDTNNVLPKTTSRKTKTEHKFVPSQHWRLTESQIDHCYNAIIDFYEKVSYTIKARALHSELADGFDVFRERGTGRYDMQLPAFDTEEFSFLTDLNKAAWMPVVKKILGDDATIVHKGAFLSMPGSAIQVYHQDGVHLTTKYQRPCHAINVFIPLVDLNMKNGPTEFCVGSHILGFDYYSKEMLDTPLAPAGTPVIFDYRLGHRGLGNSSQHPRPIVYLTYTSASKEFRDSVNFSKQRYRKLGDLIDKPISRKERALRRSV